MFDLVKITQINQGVYNYHVAVVISDLAPISDLPDHFRAGIDIMEIIKFNIDPKMFYHMRREFDTLMIHHNGFAGVRSFGEVIAVVKDCLKDF